MSLNNCMPCENIKKPKIIYTSWECFNQTLNNYILHENKIKKNINPLRLYAERKARISIPKFGKFL